MLPRKLHIGQINRFHDLMYDLNKKIDAEPDDNKKGELCLTYVKLDFLRMKLDEFIEFTLKHELDILENDDRKF